MDFGLHLGTRGAAAHPDNLARIAQHADGLGLAYLGFSDHVVIARSIDSRYPYNETGDWPGVATGFCLEQLSCLAYAAAITKRIRLLTSVMVLPHRPPVLTAKTLATVDVLSKGRVTVGVGVGWRRGVGAEAAIVAALAARVVGRDALALAFRQVARG
jgi:alkanesulfonate monooxygenase SsuD/methylene tetrahydromethanopterin reductase-like flavin-dependent oxidoreductase (luciferase family)